MRDPSLSPPPIRSSAASSVSPGTRLGLEHFQRLHRALDASFAALPPDAQTLVRRGAFSTSTGTPPPAPAPSASTTYLSTRDEIRSMQDQSSARLPHISRQRAPEPAEFRVRSSATSSRAPSHGHSYPGPTPPTEPPVHRVYVLRCASCDTFLSDRGMRAVLLLKPNIVLFSTDATPTNSSALWPDPTVHELPAERTCDCLTSSLGCHGCGSTVGYHIVQPCQRCTASVHRHQRSANHHRYVFHHNEVTFFEREYYPGEAGVTGPRYTPNSQSPSRSPSPSPLPRTQSPEVELPSASAADPDAKEGGLRPPELHRSSGDRATPISTPSTASNALRAGDVLYWTNLASGGERPRPVDPKTRRRLVRPRAGR